VVLTSGRRSVGWNNPRRALVVEGLARRMTPFSAGAFLICELMMDFPYADYCEKRSI
jgi:hypothetical protein